MALLEEGGKAASMASALAEPLVRLYSSLGEP